MGYIPGGKQNIYLRRCSQNGSATHPAVSPMGTEDPSWRCLAKHSACLVQMVKKVELHHRCSVRHYWLSPWSVTHRIPLHSPHKFYTSVFKTCLLTDPSWLRKISTDPHILAHGWWVYKLKKKSTSGRILDNHKYKTAAYITIHFLIWPWTVTRFVGTGWFFGYSKGHME